MIAALATAWSHIGLVASDLGAGKRFSASRLWAFEEGHAKRKREQWHDLRGPPWTCRAQAGEYFELSARPSRFDQQEEGDQNASLPGSSRSGSRLSAGGRAGREKLEPIQNTRGKQERFPFLLFDPDHSRIEFKPLPTVDK